MRYLRLPFRLLWRLLCPLAPRPEDEDAVA